MNWKKQISGCFGTTNHKFASHPVDIKHAVKMLDSAIKQGVGYKEYCKEIKDWLRNQLRKANPQVAKRLIDSEMKKVRKLSTYFPND